MLLPTGSRRESARAGSTIDRRVRNHNRDSRRGERRRARTAALGPARAWLRMDSTRPAPQPCAAHTYLISCARTVCVRVDILVRSKHAKCAVSSLPVCAPPTQAPRHRPPRGDVRTAITTDAETHERVIGGADAKSLSDGMMAERSPRSNEEGARLAAAAVPSATSDDAGAASAATAAGGTSRADAPPQHSATTSSVPQARAIGEVATQPLSRPPWFW